MFTSVIGQIEVHLAVRRATAGRLMGDADTALASVNIVELTPEVRRVASASDRLRALDAIHLASALSLGPVVDHVLCYDRRLADAARARGLRVQSPGLITPSPD